MLWGGLLGQVHVCPRWSRADWRVHVGLDLSRAERAVVHMVVGLSLWRRQNLVVG